MALGACFGIGWGLHQPLLADPAGADRRPYRGVRTRSATNWAAKSGPPAGLRREGRLMRRKARRYSPVSASLFSCHPAFAPQRRLHGIPRQAPTSALHQVHVFDRDRAAVAEIDHEDGKPDRRFRRRHGEHDEREHLADEVAESGGERHQVDVDGEQDQLDRHQDDDHVLAVEENAENPEREQDRGDREVMAEADGQHRQMPSPGRTWRISIAVLTERAFCSAMFWRRTFGLWRRVSTIAPIMATSRTSPAAWK